MPGVIDGVDSTPWCHAFAALVFGAMLAVFLSPGLVIMPVGWP